MAGGWEATGEEGDLREAVGILHEIRDRAPAARRALMIANVPLHRRIAEAGEGGGTVPGVTSS